MKTTIQLGLLVAASMLTLSNMSFAAFNGFEFNGNINGFQKLNYDTDTKGGANTAQTNMRTAYVFNRNLNATTQVIAISARKISFNTNEGGRARSFASYSNGNMTGRVKCAGNDAKNTWGAFWLWNEGRDNNTWEIDMMECTPEGNQNNVYVTGNQNRPGAKKNLPNSLSWRNNFRDYNVKFNAGNAITDFNNGGVTHRTNQGTRTGKKVTISLQNRPWAFSVNNGKGGANLKFFAEFQCDWVRTTFN